MSGRPFCLVENQVFDDDVCENENPEADDEKDHNQDRLDNGEEDIIIEELLVRNDHIHQKEKLKT